MISDKKTLVVIQEHVPHYRVAFYEKLRESLSKQNVELTLYYSPENSKAAIPGDIPWAKKIRTKKIWKFVWQPVLKTALDADAVILPQENKYLINYLLVFLAPFSRLKVALWGHGKDFQQESGQGVSAYLKSFVSTQVNWWFAYTEKSKRVVEGLGFDPHRITVVQNTIDTDTIKEGIRQTSENDLKRTRRELGIQGNHVAIFTGRYTDIKRTQFLLDCALEIRKRVPDFHLILIGNGPQSDLVEQAAEKHSFIHPLGALGDYQKVPYWMISKICLMPGALGLVIVDSMIFGCPLVTTNIDSHGPEIEYLKDESNGLIFPGDEHDVFSFAEFVSDLFQDDRRYSHLRQRCLESGEGYSISEMVQRFSCGVRSMLNLHRSIV